MKRGLSSIRRDDLRAEEAQRRDYDARLVIDAANRRDTRSERPRRVYDGMESMDKAAIAKRRETQSEFNPWFLGWSSWLHAIPNQKRSPQNLFPHHTRVVTGVTSTSRRDPLSKPPRSHHRTDDKVPVSNSIAHASLSVSLSVVTLLVVCTFTLY